MQLLLAYVGAPRYEGPEFDQQLVDKDARVLYKAGEKRFGTDEKTFIQIFSERSKAHLVAVSSVYRNLYGHTLKKVNILLIASHFSLLWVFLSLSPHCSAF